MDRFIARENIRHFRTMLATEIDQETRARLHRLLVEEEDKLAKDLELLADIERHIEDGHRQIETQRARVDHMRATNHCGLAQGEAFLDGLIESQRIHAKYCATINKSIAHRRLVDLLDP